MADLYSQGHDDAHNDNDLPPFHYSDAYDKVLAALGQGRLPWSVFRASAEGEEEEAVLSYGVLSVAVEILALLLFVETCRRHMDHLAVNRPIFQAVLEGVYRELATLGMVELFIHLLHEYQVNVNAHAEKVFVDIHFLFFFCAIFNALESSLLAFLAFRVSHNDWVRTEELEAFHYVEIREEFDRVRKELYGDDPPHSKKRRNKANQNMEPRMREALEDLQNNIQKATVDFYESSGTSCFRSIQLFCMGIFYTIKYPHLKAKYNRLLLQVRFHDLRVHFLECVYKEYVF